MSVLLPLALAAAAAAPPEHEPHTAWIERHLPQRGQWELGGFVGGFIIHPEHDFYDPATGPQRALSRGGPEAGLRAAYFPLSVLGVEAEWSGVWTKVVAADDAPAFLYGFRGHVLLQLPLYRIAPFVLGGYGLMGVRSPRDALGNDIDPMGHYGGGVKLFADRRFAVRVEGRHYLGPATHRRNRVASHGSVIVGLSIRLGPHASRAPEPTKEPVADLDSDRDGKIDRVDRCPWEASDAADGCKQPDFDADGFLDVDDACPREAGTTPRGCIEPDPPTEPDPDPDPAPE
jgi:hypothetical protein